MPITIWNRRLHLLVTATHHLIHQCELLYCLSSSTHPVPGGVLPKPQTGSELIDKFIRRSVKSGFCPVHLQSFGGLCETAEEKLFNQVLYNPLHVLHQLLPRQSTASQNYNLRPRKHDIELPENNLTWLIQILLTDCYFLTCTNSCMLFPHFSFLSVVYKYEYDDDAVSSVSIGSIDSTPRQSTRDRSMSWENTVSTDIWNRHDFDRQWWCCHNPMSINTSWQ